MSANCETQSVTQSETLCKQILDELKHKNMSHFQKCANIHQLLSGGFGNDLLDLYPKITAIITRNLMWVMHDNGFIEMNNVKFATKHIIDAYLISGKIGDTTGKDVLDLITKRGFTIADKDTDNGLNRPDRIMDRMLRQIVKVYTDKTQTYVTLAKQIHGNAFKYTTTCYIDDCVPINFTCACCHNAFERLPNEHLSESFKCFDCFIQTNSGSKGLEKSHAWTQIMNGLYLGEYRAILNTGTLATCKIKAIIDLTNGTTLPRSVTQLRLKKHIVKVDDNVHANIAQHFQGCINFIDQQLANNKNVLVYCKQGVSRSASIIIAYLMAKTRATFHTTLAYVKSRRQQALPNKAFIKQLQDFEQTFNTVGSVGT